mgnify:CR=1 FL=1
MGVAPPLMYTSKEWEAADGRLRPLKALLHGFDKVVILGDTGPHFGVSSYNFVSSYNRCDRAGEDAKRLMRDA